MKRLEEILEKAWSKNTNNEPLDEKYIGETTAIHEAMKLYAREVAQASLQKAAENAATIYTNHEQTRSQVHKPSITHESNIVML